VLGKYRKRGFSITCLDEFTAVISPYRERCWFLSGIRPEAKINYTREKLHGIGLLGTRSFDYVFCESLTQADFVSAIKKFLESKPRLLVVLDNANWHKGKLVDELKNRRKKTLKLVYLPPYSPELNPMELVVKDSKKVLANKIYENTKEMKCDLRKAYMQKHLFRHKMFKYLCP
jgi:transposase